MSDAPKVFTIAASAPFAQTLAQGLIARFGSEDGALALASATIYLPTRRAARGFGDAFARVLHGAALLPQFRALGDADEEDLLFDAASEGIQLAPAIAPLRRQLLLAGLVRRWHKAARGATLSFAQGAALADSLAIMLDEVETQGADLGRLAELAPPDLAAHWQSVTGFLDVLQAQWPLILAEEGKLDPAARRAAVTQALAARLAAQSAASGAAAPVIAAGSTGSIPATADLLGVIARLPQGAVVLPGLDPDLDEESWSKLDPGHPQYGLKQLLGRIGVARGDVAPWHPTARNAPRESLLRETLRPAPTTDAWRALARRGAHEIASGLEGVSLVLAADPAEEALAIALALRENLQTPGRTAALVTPDRNLARRVAAELRRWNIAIDDSAGRPLAHTGAGAFLCLLAEAAEARFAPVPLLALLKHPFATMGQDSGAFRARARELDRWCLRGPRPDAGLAGIAAAIAQTAANLHRTAIAEPLAALARWWDRCAAILRPLEEIFERREAPLDSLIETHIAAAQLFACDVSEDCLLWRSADGEAAALLVAAFKEAAEALPAIEPGSYPALLRHIAMKTPVRAPSGQHPRLAILGPLEARLQHFDLTILGGLNEGIWPRGPGADMWFSRPMRDMLGLERPERAIGLAAHDFAMLAAGPRIVLTRALKADGVPTIASRWLQRLQQLTRGLNLEIADCGYTGLAARMMETAPAPRLRRPAPTPPVAVRPRKLSVTEIETWLRDPYAIYGRHVLRLRPLGPLDEPVGPLERGTALHRALEIFIGRYPGGLPDDAAAILAKVADEVFAELSVPKAALALWRPRFLGAARWFVAYEQSRRADIIGSHLEVKGKRLFAAPGGDFELRGVADRIDLLRDGGAAILDYKTGALPSAKQVEQLLSPQLPLEAAILSEGGFEGLGRLTAEQLIYLRLSGGAKPGEERCIEKAPELAARAVAALASRIAWFDEETTPYLPRVRPYLAEIAGDYDHLARVREWSPSGWVEEEEKP